ncbi:MAG: hypothetical protein FWE07_03865 [Turicibacter sp.]|nr:hypothetical protein [Turicibacter sp.]
MNDIETKLKAYNNKLKKIDEELKDLPLGLLVKRNNFYYQLVKSDSSRSETGITKNEPRIRELARQKLLLSNKKQFAQATKALEQATAKATILSPIELIKSLPKAYQDLPPSYFYHSSVQEWVEAQYVKNTYKTDELRFRSNGGTMVRSKSELMIANKLEEYGIPYRYDAGMRFGDVVKYPDFTIKNPYTGEIIIWEHFGALHLEGYETAMNEKMEVYLNHGLIPFKNLIYTFEFDLKSNKQDRLKSIIENIILKT